MKILVLNNMVPFIRGGAELLATQLVRHLRRQGHEAELMRIPFRWDPVERIYDEILACRMMRLFNVDRVIGLKFPAYLIPHPRKTLWLVHQYRQAYDLAHSPSSNLPDDTRGQNVQQAIVSADRECFAHTESIYAISRVVQERLAKFNGFPAKVLHPPLEDAEIFRPTGEENYLFCGGRINSAKRQHLVVEAMRHVRSDVRLLIAGPADSPADAQRLLSLIDRHRLSDRVQVELGFHPRERLAAWVNSSLACAIVPHEEDYGYVTLEAFYAGKPVITTTDAGGVLEFVANRVNGLVAMPDARSLAQAIDELATNPQSRRHWGEAARTSIHERKINWPETVKRLVA
jgi:glycosyltransferase involved in cell wall biosynthesis